METKLTNSPKIAAQIFLKGGVVAFPTETVYGLGANVFDESHVKKIFIAKGRPIDNPLIAHVYSFHELELLVRKIPIFAEQFIEAFFPGALTIILPRSKYVPLVVTGGLSTIGVRMPSLKLTRHFLRECGTPVAAPSANLSGKPSSTSWKAVQSDFNGKIEAILKGDESEFGIESTVIDCSVKIPIVLRLGAISIEELQKIVPETTLYKSIAKQSTKSPGMKYRHYAPNAEVKIFDANANPNRLGAFIGIIKPESSFSFQKICPSVTDYARSLYAFFRECDQQGIKTIYCQSVSVQGIGRALMDRIHKAAKNS